ncbi:AzlD domain-containing protein [Sansalvadorimonas sp. 2012CJ34-2]|uniref:AzlD domain-containing protein n=1 Tax=Parendozoicomonas callyspongiae TaxID=2942213 RepID=A0ABT0PGC3_9GAMM|nr:AzlD domain-containing protein [Sansalvadorimonas sp. 2012CJ34-2]MCL6270370.1 AzlD domain-containing protein [Sansalvadorimonas sp. 2012CJ34-2]
MNEWTLIFLMALITFSIRYVLIASAGRWHIPSTIERGLKYVPIAVLSAIVVQTIMVSSGTSPVQGWAINPHFLVSAIVAFVVSRVTNSLMITVMAGLFCYGVIHYMLG